MLVLSRKAGESVIIGGNIVVTILNNSGNLVRIGVTAPREVSIHREEVYYRINNEAPASGESQYVHAAGGADRASV